MNHKAGTGLPVCLYRTWSNTPVWAGSSGELWCVNEYRDQYVVHSENIHLV